MRMSSPSITILTLLVSLPGCTPSYADVDERDSSSPTTATLVRPGPWRTVDAGIEGDPCGFDAYTSSFGYPTRAFLPTTFEVSATADGFLIEATAYNLVRGPVSCPLDGDRFVCETQVVRVQDLYVYEIDFAGERLDTETIRGTAVVRFELDAESESALRDAGFEMSDCDHTVDLELAYGRF